MPGASAAPGIAMRDDGWILGGQFSVVQWAIGTARSNEAAARFLRDLVEEAKASGLAARLIDKHGVRGLSVAPAA